jgi:hypothetical protein
MSAKIEIHASIREFAEMSITQAEKAFDTFINAANKSAMAMPKPAAEISKTALSFTEQNLRTSIDHTRRLVSAQDLAEVMRLQTEFLQAQFAATMKLLGAGVSSTAKDTSEG